MKKILAFILTFTLMFTLAVPMGASALAKADPKIKLDEAITKVKTALELKTDDYNFSYNYNDNQNGLSTWELSWNSKKATGGGIYVSIDSETGDIVNYNSYIPYSTQTNLRIPKYSKAEAQAAVEKFLNKIAPDKFKETSLKDNPNSIMNDKMIYTSDSYSFNYIREINGLDFFENGMNISIDKNTLAIRNYSLTWDKGTFADPTKVISIDKAKEIFGTKEGLGLAYNLISNNDKKTVSPILVYSLKNGNYPIDALTGDIINNSINPIAFTSAAADKAAVSNSTGLTPQEQSSVDASGKYISKDQAILEAKKYISVTDKFNLNSANLNVNDSDKSATWYINWDYSATKGSYSYASVTVDAITGKMISFSMYGNDYYPDKDSPVSYTKDQGKEIAAKFISSLEPDKFKITEFKDLNQNVTITPNQDDYSFAYVAKVNGATCNFDTFNITINPYTGKVMTYSSNWTDVTFTTTAGAITLDNAYSSLYKVAKLNLRYIKYSNYEPGKPATSQVKLAYVLDGLQGDFDAKTGLQIDYAGNPITVTPKIDYTDIKGNTAENAISTLVDMGIIDDTTATFSPDASILQKDFIKMLIKSLPNNYIAYSLTKDGAVDYTSYYDTAIQKGILTEAQKNPEAKVTRQDAAKYIIRAMGLGYLANDTGIFVPTYKDANKINKAYKGYAAIASSIHLLPSTNGNFDGNSNITRGQSASTIVNYLKVDTTK